MKPITDLRPAIADKWLNNQAARLDPQSLFTIDFNDIAREQKAANGDGADPVRYGLRAEAQVRRLCDAFGFAQLPQTWAEFKGMWDYCQMLQGLLLGPRDGPLAKDIRQHSLETVQRYFPKDYAAAVAFFDNDLARLGAIHSAENTMARLAEEHREFLSEA